MRMSFGSQILFAVLFGVITGLFLGSYANFLQPISSIYAMLLQMVILPYITFFIIHGLASSKFESLKQILKKCWTWPLLWVLVFILIFLFSILIPPSQRIEIVHPGTSLSIREEITKNIITNLVPENPIYDFVNNIVPSIAIFAVIVGVALMMIEKKEPLLSLLERGNQVIEKILQGLATLAPVGVFAHISVFVGTVEFDHLNEVMFYVISIILIALLVSFWILPWILSCLTSISYKEALGSIWKVCYVPFLTGIPMIAIPFIHQQLKIKEQPIYQVVVPISYSFVQIGNCLLFFFIIYAAFDFRHPISMSEKSLLSVLMVPLTIGSFTSSQESISFLFNELKFPEDVLFLYNKISPITIHFQVLLSIAGIWTFILLLLYMKKTAIDWKKLIILVSGTFAICLLSILILRPHLHFMDHYRLVYQNRSLAEAIDHPLRPARIYQPGESIPEIPDRKEGSVLENILRSGVLRVGYAKQIPYVYFNQSKDLVGFDIAMAYQLAHDLNCRLEFIPADPDHFGEELKEGLYDIAMCAVVMNEDRILQMSFSDTYADQNFVLIVPQKNRSKFQSYKEVQSEKGLVIGAMGGFKSVIESNFPAAKVFQGNATRGIEMDQVGAWLSSQISASMWCLEHPDYMITDLEGNLGKCYVAYSVKPDAIHFLRFINNWMQLKILDQFYKEQNDYWILGKTKNNPKKPRWSIMSNILHWTKG